MAGKEKTLIEIGTNDDGLAIGTFLDSPISDLCVLRSQKYPCKDYDLLIFLCNRIE